MPEAQSEQSTETAGGEDTSSTNQTSQESSGSETDNWKARARDWEKRAKANADAARKLAELEDKEKTDQQRLADRIKAADEAKAEAERILARAKVANAKGLPPELAERLRGDTEEEMLADADSLLELTKASAPRPDLKQGARGAVTGQNDVDAWIRKQAGR